MSRQNNSNDEFPPLPPLPDFSDSDSASQKSLDELSRELESELQKSDLFRKEEISMTELDSSILPSPSPEDHFKIDDDSVPRKSLDDLSVEPEDELPRIDSFKKEEVSMSESDDSSDIAPPLEPIKKKVTKKPKKKVKKSKSKKKTITSKSPAIESASDAHPEDNFKIDDGSVPQKSLDDISVELSDERQKSDSLQKDEIPMSESVDSSGIAPPLDPIEKKAPTKPKKKVKKAKAKSKLKKKTVDSKSPKIDSTSDEPSVKPDVADDDLESEKSLDALSAELENELEKSDLFQKEEMSMSESVDSSGIAPPPEPIRDSNDLKLPEKPETSSFFSKSHFSTPALDEHSKGSVNTDAGSASQKPLGELSSEFENELRKSDSFGKEEISMDQSSDSSSVPPPPSPIQNNEDLKPAEKPKKKGFFSRFHLFTPKPEDTSNESVESDGASDPQKSSGDRSDGFENDLGISDSLRNETISVSESSDSSSITPPPEPIGTDDEVIPHAKQFDAVDSGLELKKEPDSASEDKNEPTASAVQQQADSVHKRQQDYFDTLRAGLDHEMRQRHGHLKHQAEILDVKNSELEKWEKALLQKERRVAGHKLEYAKIKSLEKKLEDNTISLKYEKSRVHELEDQLKAKQKELDAFENQLKSKEDELRELAEGLETRGAVIERHTPSQIAQFRAEEAEIAKQFEDNLSDIYLKKPLVEESEAPAPAPTADEPHKNSASRHFSKKISLERSDSLDELRAIILKCYDLLCSGELKQAAIQYGVGKDSYQNFVSNFGDDSSIHGEFTQLYNDITTQMSK